MRRRDLAVCSRRKLHGEPGADRRHSCGRRRRPLRLRHGLEHRARADWNCIAAPTQRSTARTRAPQWSTSTRRAAARFRPRAELLRRRGQLPHLSQRGGAERRAQKLDYYAAFSRFDTSNALPTDEYHSATAAANLGYNIIANTQARFTHSQCGFRQRSARSSRFLRHLRQRQAGRSGPLLRDYSGEPFLQGNWHNLVRYGIARKREQEKQFANVGTPITYNFGTVPCSAPTADCFTEYFGNVVTIRGANGYTATGQASFFLPNEDSGLQSRRALLPDRLQLSSPHHRSLRLPLRERARQLRHRISPTRPFSAPTSNTRCRSRATSRAVSSTRLAAAFEKNHLYGIAGTPRIGFVYAPVRPRPVWFHGTRCEQTPPPACRSPALALEFASLYTNCSAPGIRPTSRSFISRRPDRNARAPTTSESTRTSSDKS